MDSISGVANKIIENMEKLCNPEREMPNNEMKEMEDVARVLGKSRSRLDLVLKQGKEFYKGERWRYE